MQASNFVRNFLIPLLGMAFFWRYFRFQSFFGVLYPLDLTHSFFGFPLHISPVFLIALLCLSAISLFLRNGIETALNDHRWVLPLVGVIGSVGVVLALVFHEGVFGSWMIWLSSSFVAVGFLGNCFAWATYFSSTFGLKEVLLLAVSYVVSLLMFPMSAVAFQATALLVLLTPVCSGIAWYFSTVQPSIKFDTTLKSIRQVNPYIHLFIVFLLAGSVIRGIVDTGGSDQNIRWGVSLVACMLIFVYCWITCGRPVPWAQRSDAKDTDDFLTIEGIAIKSWVLLALLFFCGLFISLSLISQDFGGNIVVIARSLLDFFLWIFLCNFAYKKRVSPILLFIVFSVLVEALSWCLSYVIVPALLKADLGAGISSPDLMGLIIAFVLISSITVVFSIVIFRKQSQHEAAIEHTSSSPFAVKVPDEIIQQYNLTQREAGVANLYIQGRSLKNVASILFISTSTAQSHIKHVYKKLDIHSKNDLIDLLSKWDREGYEISERKSLGDANRP